MLETGEPEYIEEYKTLPRFGDKWVELWAFKIGYNLEIISRDITNRKTLENELHKVEHFDTVNRMGATFARDLRSPLSAISYAAWIGKKKPELSEKMFDIITSSVDRSIRMLEEFRKGSRGLKVVKMRVDLFSLVKNVVEEVQVPEQINVNLDLPEGFEAEFDLEIIRRVLDNLVRNAVEAMSGGDKLTISVKQNGGGVVIEVMDTGTGISEKDAKNLFEPLFTTKKGGLGLGLYFVRMAAEAVGGRVDFVSKIGEGTTFTIRLPLR